MNRGEFLAGASALPFAMPVLRRAQDVDDLGDPASQAQTQALRVLLGTGDAQRIDAQGFTFQGRHYRGSFSYTASGQLVSLVPLEQYLYSVVPREMPRSWPAAALQAQAIVARTYVLQRSNPRRDYDLIPSEADQVYTGMDAEHPESSAAVDATAGQVLRFGAGFAEVLYSSCCGGHTESNADAWGGRMLPYLAGVACTYCAPSPWYSWSQRVTLGALRTSLAQQLPGIEDIESVALDTPDASGRARFWIISGAVGSQRLKAEDVRRALGTRALPSLLVRKLTLDPPQTQAPRGILIEGAGLGHGVGLCQWGARGMALAGADVRTIVSFYYPGTVIGND